MGLSGGCGCWSQQGPSDGDLLYQVPVDYVVFYCF